MTFEIILICLIFSASIFIIFRIWKSDLTTGFKSKQSFKEAERRANALLKEFLTDEEYWQLKKFGYLEVQSPSIPNRIYRIPRYQGVVKVYDRDVLTMYLCVQPKKFLPSGDLVLMHKLHIEANEDDYLRIANRWVSAGIPLRDNWPCRIR